MNLHNQHLEPEYRVAHVATFRTWLREQLRAQEFYQRRGNKWLLKEFVQYARDEFQVELSELSLTRYFNEKLSVLPTMTTCRDLATVLGVKPWEVMKVAGYVYDSDLETPKKRVQPAQSEPNTAA